MPGAHRESEMNQILHSISLHRNGYITSLVVSQHALLYNRSMKIGYVPRLALVVLVLLTGWSVRTAAQEPTPEPPAYVVQSGDTLFRIAQRFGTTVEAIVAANGITNPSLIQVGQKLIIPTVEPTLVVSPEPRPETWVHPVHPGEMLPSLAFRYGTTVWALREVNGLNRYGLLWPGQELTIPPPTVPHRGVPVFPEVSASPAPVLQGQTVFIEVRSRDNLALNGSLLGKDLRFAEEEGRYFALAGVDALTASGGYPLALKVTELSSGDRLTMQETFTVAKGSFTTYNIVIPADRQWLLDPKISDAEAKRVNAVFAGVSESRLWAGIFGVPLGGELRITAPFGQRRSYGGGPPTSYHAGQDYGADEGTPVLAPITGTVALAEPLQVRGNAVILDHGWGVFSGFWHLSRIDVVPGQVVGRGEVIGLTGNTGLSTGPHLHWEMRVLGVPVDPLQWTQQEFPTPLPTPQLPTPLRNAPIPDGG
jgi:murein DD-endopeptidase MepM/ murein hydrolase activator NlpD